MGARCLPWTRTCGLHFPVIMVRSAALQMRCMHDVHLSQFRTRSAWSEARRHLKFLIALKYASGR